jgi:ABC-type multidrug transport system ATPase subunit
MVHAIETRELTRRFGRLDAVNGLNLAIPQGSFFAFIGPNGAGKTTTIKLLMNLLRPTRGAATVLGTDSRRLAPPDLQRIGYVSENQRLPDWMTPTELLAYCRPMYPTWDDDLSARLARGLSIDTAQRLRSLSRGTRMKAALLASLSYRPELVVLDEPFTGLDPAVRDDLIRALLELAAEKPCTVLVSSHDIEEVERLADWVGFIESGRLMFAEPVASLLSRFRLVEVVSTGDAAPAFVDGGDRWLQGVAGRTLRFIDGNAAGVERERELAAMYPHAEVRFNPLSLREIFVAIVRRHATDQQREVA